MNVKNEVQLINEDLTHQIKGEWIKEKEQLRSIEGRRRVLIISWEYPPLMVGGLSRHVFDLSIALVNCGWTVDVVTTAVSGKPIFENSNGVNVHRIHSLQAQEHLDNFYDWVGSLNIAFTDYILSLVQEGNSFDLVHAHDWLVCSCAKVLKEALNIPLVATIHATEHGRNGGIYSELQKKIHQKEWQLTYEASHVIVCSDYMVTEVIKLFQLPKEKIFIIPNGVNEEMVCQENSNFWRKKFGSEEDTYIFSVGRIVNEKGYQTLIDAAFELKKQQYHVKFIVAGKGPLLEQYRHQVKLRQLEDVVYFVGFITDKERNEFFNGADICVFPSYYEPFGIVALESMIATKPTIVSNVGGLKEIITHEHTGLTVYPQDQQSLVTQIKRCIEDQDLAKKIAINGRNLAKSKYSWNTIAQQTIAIYYDALPDN